MYAPGDNIKEARRAESDPLLQGFKEGALFNIHETTPDRYGTEPVIGWRTWYLDEGGALYSPRGVVHVGEEAPIPDGLWLPGEPFEARCWVQAIPQHPAPARAEVCSDCGVHAWRYGLVARFMFDLVDDPVFLPEGYTPVYGQVALWGRVQEHEDGYRGQFAYPHMLRVKGEDQARRLYQTYGVEAEAV